MRLCGTIRAKNMNTKETDKTIIYERNPFVALCDYASQNDWCWKLMCTTCGHSAFKVSFSKITMDQHPDDELFWPYGKENHSPLKEIDRYNSFSRRASLSDQEKLAVIVSQANLSDIQHVAKFPEWLGYVGLVLEHCSSHNSREIISNSFLPQFIELLKNDSAMCDYFKEKQSKDEFLDIGDLSKIEGSIMSFGKNM